MTVSQTTNRPSTSGRYTTGPIASTTENNTTTNTSNRDTQGGIDFPRGPSVTYQLSAASVPATANSETLDSATHCERIAERSSANRRTR